MNIPAGWDLPTVISERLSDRSGRQRAIIAEGHLLLILHEAPRTSETERVGAFFWRSPDGVWHASDGRHGVSAVKAHLEKYDQAVERLEAQYNQARTAREYFEILEAIVPLHRAASNQHAALQTAREGVPDAREIIAQRDLAGDIERTAELLHADAKNAMDFRIAEQAEAQARAADEMAQAGHRLNLLIALFLPASVIGGAFGTTLKSGLEDAPAEIFWFILLCSFAFGAAVYVLIARQTTASK